MARSPRAKANIAAIATLFERGKETGQLDVQACPNCGCEDIQPRLYTKALPEKKHCGQYSQVLMRCTECKMSSPAARAMMPDASFEEEAAHALKAAIHNWNRLRWAASPAAPRNENNNG